MNKDPLLQLLTENNFVFQLHHHEAICTVEAGRHLQAQIAGAHSKNLFIKDPKKHFFLVSVLENKRVDLKALAKHYGKGRFSFGTAEELAEKLHLLPGSVTPYALMCDKDHTITFILDEDFLNFETVNFHPLQNDITLNMATQSFLRFFALINHSPVVMKIPTIG